MKSKFFVVVTIILLAICAIIGYLSSDKNIFKKSNEFVILSNEDNAAFDNEIIEFGQKNNIRIKFVHADDLEAIDLLSQDSTRYDAVWLSNSTWIYMLDGVKTLNSKSISINPVVFGVKKSKALELGFVDKEIYNKDIINAIKEKKLSYVMSSVVKTNTGLLAYLGFLNVLSGSPELLTLDMLKSKELETEIISLFSGVKRVSGTEGFLNEMFLNSSDYEAVVASESALININKQLEASNKEPLYLLYPVDGVTINDSPFAYIDNKQEKLEKFDLIQSFLLKSDTRLKLESYGKRTWYGGVKANADKSSFKKDWGIDTTSYLTLLKTPSKDVINEAIALYLEKFRKPSVTAFCLDYSGSMYGDGISELKSAMEYILDYETAKNDKIQFSSKDIIFVYPFSDTVGTPFYTDDGKNTSDMIYKIKSQNLGGQTNLYGCAATALKKVIGYNENYMKTIILMTDGEANVGSFKNLENAYKESIVIAKEKVPIYSIMFASARESQLEDIAELSNAKVFDGRYNLTEAFKEVRSYN